MIVLFVDAYDVVFTASMDTILDRFLTQAPYEDYRVLFGAEPYCWPDESLAIEYPVVEFGKRYLNSGLFMGYAKEVYQMISLKDVADNDDDQLYYTMVYLDDKLRAYNAAYNTHPAILHGNGPSKRHLNYLANYVANPDFPLVAVTLFIAKPIPFIEEMLEVFARHDYPKKRIALFIYNSQRSDIKTVMEFLSKYGSQYYTKKIINGVSEIQEREARQEALTFASRHDAEYLFACGNGWGRFFDRNENAAVFDRILSELRSVSDHFMKKDERLAGGYENVPTRDIHMRQV
ncbi:hypothetical protein GCK32_013773, partial [Trichostrongylus colubriformis]